MRHILRLIAFAFLIITGSGLVSAQDAITFEAPSQAGATRTLTIYSSLDIDAARPLIKGFQKANRSLTVIYEEMQTLDIYERVLQETDNTSKTADLIISSAMDLQMKLANDGYARRIPLQHANRWPNWANWRNTAIALTYEPSVLVYHKPSFEAAAVPQTRAALQGLLLGQDEKFFGRFATYDIERAGVGYLFLARDAEHHPDIWRFVQSMGATGVKLYSNSSAILERVSDGRFAIGYNILGSYAAAWAEQNPDLGIILPTDYTVVMSRIALVPEAANHADLGTQFLDFLMSPVGQKLMAQEAKLPALHPDVDGPNTASALRQQAGSQLRPISVSPALLVYLDQVKRSRFIKKWNDALNTK